MNDKANYIFVFPQFPKNFVGKMDRQSKAIAQLGILAVAGAAYAVWAETKRRKQEDEIYKLTIKVNKLERNEGE